MYLLIQADLIDQRERVSTFKLTNGLGDPEIKFYAGTFRILDGDEVVKLSRPECDNCDGAPDGGHTNDEWCVYGKVGA